jgi:DNA-binding transcriptional LysR family regulator
MIESKLLRAFVTTADAGSFSLAADRLHITQSTISQQIARLEEVVGRELFNRSTRPIQLTSTGEKLIGYARRILMLQSEAETLLADPAGTASIRIGMPDDIVTPEITSVFANFVKQHQALRLDVTTGLSSDLIKRYRENDLDLVVVKEATPGADHRATFPEPIAWYEAAKLPVEWSEPFPLVTFPPGGLYRSSMFDRIDKAHKRWYVAFSSGSLNSIIAAVEAGLGLSLLPIGAVKGRQIRLFAGFPVEPPMAVSLYAWEGKGIVGELAKEIVSVLKARYESI